MPRNSFGDWRRQGIFLQDAQPSIYLYVQRFTVPGGTLNWSGAASSPWAGSKTIPPASYSAMSRLWPSPRPTAWNCYGPPAPTLGRFSCCTAILPPKSKALLAPGGQPDLETLDEYGVSHRVWKDLRSGPGQPGAGQDAGQEADHRRRPSPLRNRADLSQSAPDCGYAFRSGPESTLPPEGQNVAAPDPAAAPYELVMMTLVNMDSPGMVILPTHRVVHGLGSFSSAAFRDGASAYFSVEEVDPSVDAARAAVILREAGRMGTALLAVTSDRVFLLDRPKRSPAKFLRDGRCGSRRLTWCNCTSACSKACWGFRKKPSASRKMSATYETW